MLSGSLVAVAYSGIALAPTAPAIAEATAMMTFRIKSQVDFLIAIVLHLLSRIFFLKFCFYIEARALLYPFRRLYLPVAVEVGTEVAVTTDACVVESLQ